MVHVSTILKSLRWIVLTLLLAFGLMFAVNMASTNQSNTAHGQTLVDYALLLAVINALSVEDPAVFIDTPHQDDYVRGSVPVRLTDGAVSFLTDVIPIPANDVVFFAGPGEDPVAPGDLPNLTHFASDNDLSDGGEATWDTTAFPDGPVRVGGAAVYDFSDLDPVPDPSQLYVGTTVGVTVDNTNPTATINSPSNGQTVQQNSSLTADFFCDDATSGVASCEGVLDGSQPVADDSALPTDTPGTHSLAVTATDNAGNTHTTTHTYTVQAEFNFTGFFSPVNNPPVVNSVKAGQAIPVKFSLNGDQGLDIFADGYPQSQQVTCDTNAPVDELEQTTTAGNSSLQYDAATDTYTYVWKTDQSWSSSCRQLSVQLSDGSVHTANFKFK
jgi:hypothetical protein